MNVPSRFSTHKRFIVVLFLLFLAIAIPITLNVVSQQQKTRQFADTPAPMACGNTPTDTVIILDKSPSMLTNNKLALAEKAAKTFIDQLAKDSRNKVALVTFGYNASVDSPFTNNYSSVKNKIDNIRTLSATCIQCGIKTANQLIASANDGQKKVAVLLTDGMPNAIDSSSRFQQIVSEKQAADAALSELKNGYQVNNASYYTIGLGNDVNAGLLKSMATVTGGEYNFSPSAGQLSNIYTHISQLIGKGSITGSVFNDKNNNGVFDTTELPLGGRTLTLTSVQAGGTTSAVLSSADDGGYVFSGLCDGTYSLSAPPSVSLAPDWQQTVPTNPSSYTVTIASGNVVSGKDFGFSQAEPSPSPSPTCQIPECAAPPVGCSYQGATACSCGQLVCTTPVSTPTSTPDFITMTLNTTIPGIGQGNGDNVAPKHPLRNGLVQIFDINNQLVSTQQVQFTYTNGSFTTTLGLKAAAGYYTVKVKMGNTLKKLIKNVQHLQQGTPNNIPAFSLTPGDMNDNNVMDISDYQSFLNCYGSKQCSQKTDADFNDDGSIDIVDYNILLRSFAVHEGD